MIHIRPIERRPVEISAVAAILVAGFADRSAAWPTHASAVTEVTTCSQSHHLSCVATINSEVVGWASASPQYNQTGWELHPIVVAPAHQKRGVGRALLEYMCDELRRRGASVLYAWSDDESQSTSLGGVDLFHDPLRQLTQFDASMRHAGGFYLANHFVLCGVIPDANGIGKPDILFARRIV